MMVVIWPAQSKIDAAEAIVYVDFLEVSPVHRADARRRDLIGVGAALLAIAQAIGNATGVGNRLGLNSLPGAVAFYRKAGMSEFPPDGSHQNLPYFETDAKL